MVNVNASSDSVQASVIISHFSTLLHESLRMHLLDHCMYLMVETCLPVCGFHLQDQNFEHLILECREGSINDAELKAHLEQCGEVIEVRIYACVCVCVRACVK